MYSWAQNVSCYQVYIFSWLCNHPESVLQNLYYRVCMVYVIRPCVYWREFWYKIRLETLDLASEHEYPRLDIRLSLSHLA